MGRRVPRGTLLLPPFSSQILFKEAIFSAQLLKTNDSVVVLSRIGQQHHLAAKPFQCFVLRHHLQTLLHLLCGNERVVLGLEMSALPELSTEDNGAAVHSHGMMGTFGDRLQPIIIIIILNMS